VYIPMPVQSGMILIGGRKAQITTLNVIHKVKIGRGYFNDVNVKKPLFVYVCVRACVRARERAIYVKMCVCKCICADRFGKAL
jgi:hypothetical protein